MLRNLILVLLTVCFAQVLVAQPKLVISEGTTFDWGDVKPEDSPLKNDFTITNEGTETLNITRVRPTCGCTTAPLDKNELAPGESTQLHVSLRLGGNAGKLAKQIRIYSNDPENDTEILTLKANIIRPISIKPRTYLQFRNMQVGVESEAILTLENNTLEELKLYNFQVTPEELSINLSDEVVIPAGGSVELKAVAKPSNKGYFSAKISMESSNENQKYITIKGFGKVEPSPIFNSNE